MRRSTVAAAAYVVAVGVPATCGFAGRSTALILLAYGLALPTGAPALVGYYLAYGLLSLLPGAMSASQEPTTALTVSTAVLGVLAPVVAALANLALLRSMLRRRRRTPVDDDSPNPLRAC